MPTHSFPINTVSRESLRSAVEGVLAHGGALALMYATDEGGQGYAVNAVCSLPGESGFTTFRAEIPKSDPRYPSLTVNIMAAHWYERQIRDQFGIVPEGHPDLRRLMHHENIPEGTHPLRKEFAWNTKLAQGHVPYPMHAVEGKGVFEIPVGPIHAGIIEPGHFRFNVRGERILALEGKLFFKHKGVEKLVEGKTPEEALPFVERVSGDMVVGHTLAYVQALERARGTTVSKRTEHLRCLYNELERITMHLFDIGNMGGMGTGFTFMAAQGFRMVEMMRRLNETLVGHRFLRGAIMLGGAHDLDQDARAKIRETINRIEKDIKKVLDIAFATDGLLERFETTGVLSKEAARAYGAQGVPARASGVAIDARHDRPYAAYETLNVAVVTEKSGDVAARFRVRVRELAESFRLVREIIADLPHAETATTFSRGSGEALGWAESWRGEVVDFVRLTKEGRIERLVIRDPSFCNWALFGELAPGNIIPDFPLCNKSLNLSYSGNDL